MRASLAVVIALLVAAPLGATAIPLPPANERWTRTTLGNTVIDSSARDSVTRDVAEHLLRAGEAMSFVTGIKAASTSHTRVLLFSDGRAFTAYKAAAQFTGDANGVFITTHLGSYIAMTTRNADALDRSVYHGYAHTVSHNLDASLPPWLDEGLAELFSDFRSDENGIVLGVPQTHMQWLSMERTLATTQHRLVNVREIIDPAPGTIDYNEDKPTGVFYGESWLLTHYLLFGGNDRRPQLAAYLALLASGTPPVDAFTTAFHTTCDAITTELRQYVGQLRRRTQRITAAELHGAAVPEPVVLARDEVLYSLGDFLTNATRDDAAEPLLRAALAANPNHTSALADLGMFLGRQGDTAEAQAMFAKAAAAGSRDPRVFVLQGEAMLARFGDRQRRGGDIPSSESLAARALFEKALALDPRDANAWAGIGATYMFTREDAKPGIDALEKSLAIEQQADVATNLVFLYARARRRTDARRVVDRIVEPAGDATLLAVARDNLLAADILDAGDLINAGKTKDALALLRPAYKIASSELLKKQISRMIDRATR